MSMLKKVITVGHSKAITLPKGWVDLAEKRQGAQLEAIEMDMGTDGTIMIRPLVQDTPNKLVRTRGK